MKSAKDTLIEARELISDFDNWTQHKEAADKHGEMVSANDPNACRFCAIGAVAHVRQVPRFMWIATRPRLGGPKIRRLLNKAVEELYPNEMGSWTEDQVTRVNDGDSFRRSRVRHKKVLAVMDRAIELA